MRPRRTLKLMLAPKDPKDDKNVILEIRAGTGGEEAALFVADLFRMYSRYAELRRWKVEILDAHPTGIGGLKEIIAEINGKGAFSRLEIRTRGAPGAARAGDGEPGKNPYLGGDRSGPSGSRRSRTFTSIPTSCAWTCFVPPDRAGKA